VCKFPSQKLSCKHEASLHKASRLPDRVHIYPVV
jgi:hypothetical protein